MSGVKTLHCTHLHPSLRRTPIDAAITVFQDFLPHFLQFAAFMMVYLDTAPLAECRGSSAASIRYAMETSDDGSTVLVKAYKGETYLGRLS